MAKPPDLPTTATIGPRPALPADRMPTLQERKAAEGITRAPRVRRLPAVAAPAGDRPRFVNRPGHVLQPAEGTVEPPHQLTAADSASPGTRFDNRPSMKPAKIWMGKRSPITRANRTPKQEPPPKPTMAGMTFGDRIRAEGPRAQLRKKGQQKPEGSADKTSGASLSAENKSKPDGLKKR